VAALAQQGGNFGKRAFLAARLAITVVKKQYLHREMSVALVTNYLPPYRIPLYELLAERHGLEVYCFGGEGAYVPAALRDLDRQLEQANFPAHRLRKQRDAAKVAAAHDVVIASTTGKVALPSAYRGARRAGRPFILWASLWRHPRTLRHLASLPFMRRLYRDSDAILTYGPHVSRYVSRIRGNERGVFAAAQAVEADLFGRPVTTAEIEELRVRLGIDDEWPIALFVGRLVPEKGIGVLLDAWERTGASSDAALCIVGDGELAARAKTTRGVRMVGQLDRTKLPVLYAAAAAIAVPSLRTRQFLEPWGLVCNEAMLQARPVIASTAVGAVAGGLVRDGQTGIVVKPGSAPALAHAITDLLADASLRHRLGDAGAEAVAGYTYDRAADAFGQAIDAARSLR
jgi:glycosyltransferase involved in cell wall biosynthesis